MGKLSKVEVRAHAEAEAVLRMDVLSAEEKDFVLENWHPAAENNVAAAGAFFSPMDLAADFALEPGQGRVIDLCAGIGGLAYWVQQRAKMAGRGGTDLRRDQSALRRDRPQTIAGSTLDLCRCARLAAMVEGRA
ncbi:hypothetical protein [Labrys sp. 22185]|uniref:hypothetical protein n=1 Tax=Labrys sp. 22185 TaxID=3453888 RepID=UPI003F872110